MKKQKKVLNKRNILLVIIICTLLLLLAVAGFYNFRPQQANILSTDTQSTSSPATNTQEQNKQLQEASPVNNGTVSSLPNPQLSVSAGQVKPAPINVPIEFVCQGPESTTCNISLTNGRAVINLPPQKIQSSRGQAATTWIWNTLPGVWDVSAYLSNDTMSNGQTTTFKIEVR